MPQFETTYLVSQIFWLLFSFGGLYLGVRFIVFPLFDNIFGMRQNKINSILNQAEQLTQKAQDLEEDLSQKKQLQEKRFRQRVLFAQEKGQQDFQTTIEQNEKRLLKVLKNQIQKMEREEKGVLTQADAFTAKVMKGNL